MDLNGYEAEVSSTEHTREYWISRDYLSTETCESLRRAAIIVVPHEGFRDFDGPVFPVGTTELLRTLQEQVPPDAGVEIAIEDKDYREVALHYDVVRLATLLLDYAIVPMVAALLADYLMKKLGSRFSKSRVEASLIVEREGPEGRKAFQLEYKGPATTFEATIKSDLAKTVCSDEPIRPSNVD